MNATATHAGTPKVTVLADGGLKVDDQKLTPEQMAAVVTAALGSGAFPGAVGRPLSLRRATERLLTADAGGDNQELASAFSDVAQLVINKVVGAAAAEAQPEQTPEREGLVQSLQEGDAVVEKFPLEVHNAGLAAGQLTALALELQPGYLLSDILKSSLEKVGRGIAPRAAQGAAWLRRLSLVIEPALHNEGLAAGSLGLRGYLSRAAEQAQRTKKLLSRARAESAEETAQALHAQARTEAEAAVRGELDDRLAALLK